jgi:hypothetical protein
MCGDQPQYNEDWEEEEEEGPGELGADNKENLHKLAVSGRLQVCSKEYLLSVIINYK